MNSDNWCGACRSCNNRCEEMCSNCSWLKAKKEKSIQDYITEDNNLSLSKISMKSSIDQMYKTIEEQHKNIEWLKLNIGILYVIVTTLAFGYVYLRMGGM